MTTTDPLRTALVAEASRQGLDAPRASLAASALLGRASLEGDALRIDGVDGAEGLAAALQDSLAALAPPPPPPESLGRAAVRLVAHGGRPPVTSSGVDAAGRPTFKLADGRKVAPLTAFVAGCFGRANGSAPMSFGRPPKP